MTYVSGGGLGADLALMHTHTHGGGCLGSHTHPREAVLALTPHTHTPVALGQAGEGRLGLTGEAKDMVITA